MLKYTLNHNDSLRLGIGRYTDKTSFKTLVTAIVISADILSSAFNIRNIPTDRSPFLKYYHRIIFIYNYSFVNIISMLGMPGMLSKYVGYVSYSYARYILCICYTYTIAVLGMYYGYAMHTIAMLGIC